MCLSTGKYAYRYILILILHYIHSFQKKTDVTANLVEHVSGKTKEYLQPNPGMLFSDNTFLLFILFLLTYYVSIASRITASSV